MLDSLSVCAGLKVTQCDFVAINNGITVTKSCLQLNVINNHINAKTACINGTDINQSCIMGNLFYKEPSTQTATVGVQINGNSAWNIIGNNVSTLDTEASLLKSEASFVTM